MVAGEHQAGSAVRVIQGGCGAPSLTAWTARPRTSERRLQAGKYLGFEELRSRFPYEFQLHFGLPCPEAERTRTASAALAAIGGAAAAAASAAAAVAAAAAAAAQSKHL